MPKLSLKDNYNKQDAALIEGFTINNLDQIETALDNGANPNLLWIPDGLPILYEAAAKGNIEIIKLLLERGAEINGLNSAQQTVLHLLAILDEVDLFNFFIERGADPSICDNQGKTALDLAVENESKAVIGLLNEYSMTVDDIEDNAELEEPVILSPGASISSMSDYEVEDYQPEEFSGVSGMFFHQFSW